MFNLTKLVSAICLVFGFGLAASAPSAAAPVCRQVVEQERHFTVCSVDSRRADLRLFWQRPDGEVLGSFAAVEAELAHSGKTLAFAMNAGMFHPDYAPVGLYVEQGRQLRPANTRPGPGNFHLQPNGVFYLGPHGAGVMETSAYLQAEIKAEYATQSGPLLVAGGLLHPKIEPTGTSEKIRNGVGVRDGHMVIFAISEEPVTFYRFARLFRDTLGCPDALFLDGSISNLYAPALGRTSQWVKFGPIVGLVEQAATAGEAGR